MKPLAWLKIWKLPQQLASLAIGLLMLFGLGWYADYRLGKRYTKAQAEAVKQAQTEATAKQLAREAANLKQRNEALNAQTQTLAKNLADANAAAESRAGLLYTIRSSEDKSKPSLTACLQHSRTVGELLEASTELAGRIAKEADGHVADKQACHDAWPK